MHAPVHLSFATDDPEAAHQHLLDLHSGTQLSVGRPGEAFRYRHDRIDLGAVALDHLHNGLTATYGVPPTGRVFVVQVLAGDVLTSVGQVERHSRSGDVFVVARPDAALHSAYSDDAVLEITSVAVSLLHDVDPQHAAERLTGPAMHALDGSTAAAWRRTHAHLQSTLDALLQDDHAPGRLVLAAHSRLLAATVLHAIAPEHHDAHRGDRVDARPAPLGRAIAHIEANPGLDITPADLAQVAGVGVRALQLAFRKHLDTTPLAYLRRVRLDRAHADLLAAGPTRHTVARIAAGWGFTDPSRFTAQYKQTYGQLPGRTLRT